MQLLNNWLKSNHLLNFNSFVNALFKQKCLLCDANIDALQPNIHAACRACLNDLPWHPKTSCPQCGLSSSGTGLNRTVCGSCISAPPDFDATISVFLYDFPIDAMMQRYKYGNMLSLCSFFGQLLNEKVAPETVDLIIPMPMHPARIKERGFNQAHEIAKILCKNHKEKLDYKSAQRQKLTPPQASLPLKERVKNIKGAFSVTGNLAGKRIAIVDDVMTTGASLNELAKTLKKAGAGHVECWVIARTLPHR
jgi:ComF family protein